MNDAVTKKAYRRVLQCAAAILVIALFPLGPAIAQVPQKKEELLQRAKEFYEAIILGDYAHAWDMRLPETACEEKDGAYTKIVQSRGMQLFFIETKEISDTNATTVAEIRIENRQYPTISYLRHGLRWYHSGDTWHWCEIFLDAPKPLSPHKQKLPAGYFFLAMGGRTPKKP